MHVPSLFVLQQSKYVQKEFYIQTTIKGLLTKYLFFPEIA